jgi:MFS family permease
MSPLFVLGLFEFARIGLVVAMLPIYGQHIVHLDLHVIGTAISLQYIFDNIFRLPSGWIADHVGGKWLIGAGIIISLSGLGLIYIARTKVLFILGAILFGLGIAPVWPTVVSGIAASKPADHVGEALSKVFIAWLVGSGLGMMLLYYVMEKSYKLAFAVLAIVLLINLLVLIAGKMPRRRHPETQAGVAYLKGLFNDLWSVKIIFPGMFLQTVAFGILMPGIAVYARSVVNLNSFQFAGFLFAIGTVCIGLLVPAGKLADRLGYKGVLIAGLLIAAAGMVLLPANKTVAYTLVFGIVMGMGYAFIFPSWNSLMARVITPQKQGMMWAVFMCIEGLGTAAGSYAGGYLWGCGYQVAFRISALVLAAMGMFYAAGKTDHLIRST